MRTMSVGMLLIFAGHCFAQSEDDFHHFTIGAGGGFTAILSSAIQLDVLKESIEPRAAAAVGGLLEPVDQIDGSQPDGNARVYSFTADPTLRLPLGHRWSAYLLAGGGYLRRTVQFTQPTLAQTFVFDPWWGYFGPGLVPVNQILGTVTSNSGAVDVGGGVNIPLPRTGFHLYVESRYFHGFTSNTNTQVVPVTVGFRW